MYGCTDPAALNYNPSATIDDGSCRYAGCTDSTATNYNPIAVIDDGSCIYTILPTLNTGTPVSTGTTTGGTTTTTTLPIGPYLGGVNTTSTGTTTTTVGTPILGGGVLTTGQGTATTTNTGCEDVVLYISGGFGNNLGSNTVVRYDPTAHQGTVMSGPSIDHPTDIAMWGDKFYVIRQNYMDEFLADYTTNTYSFVQSLPSIPYSQQIHSVSYDMRDAVTLVSHQHNGEKIFTWDISNGQTAVLNSSLTINIGVKPVGDLVVTSQGFVLAYDSYGSTNPPSAGKGIAHYDFAGNLIDFVENVSVAGMYKTHSTGEIFFDNGVQLNGGPARGLYQLFYDGVPMSIGPQVQSNPYPPIDAVNWQGASSHCVSLPPAPAPRGFHYMPDGSLMLDSEMEKYQSQAPLTCTFDQVSNEAKATVAPAYLGMGLPNQQSAAYVAMFNSGFFTFVNNMWAGYQNGGCNFWTNRVNHWTNQIANNSYNAYTLARKQAKILFAQNLHTICGCPGLPPAKITNIELDYSALKQSGELRDFKIIGENGAKFKLEIKNEDSSYYNFYTNSFSSTYSFLEEEIKNGFYRGSITFPAVSDDDHYNINLFTLENTKHSTSIQNVDYTELRFDDGSIDINGSRGSNSNLLEKIIYQYTTATLTMSAYSSSGGVSVHAQGTDDITVDKVGQKELTPFSFTVTASPTVAYRVLKQPEADDLIAFVSPTVGSVGIPLPGEDIFAGAARSSNKVVDGDFSGGATNITMDDDIGDLWAVGDRVTGNAILDAKTGSSAVTITHVNVGSNAKVFTISESIAIADNETLTFTEPRYKRWEVDSKADIVKEGMLLVQGTNTEVGTKLAEFEDSTLVNENTFKEEKIRSKIFKAVDTKDKKPTLTKGIVSAQGGEIIFDTPQRIAIAGTALKIGGYGLEEVFRITGYDIELSELAIALTTTTTTTTEASAGGSSADITVASAEGIISNVSRVGGVGINSALQNPLITSVDFPGKDLTMDAAQTLENGVTLTVENTSKVATISGKIKLNYV